MVEINSAVRTAAASAIELFAMVVVVVVASMCLLLLTLFYVGVLFLLVFWALILHCIHLLAQI